MSYQKVRDDIRKKPTGSTTIVETLWYSIACVMVSMDAAEASIPVDLRQTVMLVQFLLL